MTNVVMCYAGRREYSLTGSYPSDKLLLILPSTKCPGVLPLDDHNREIMSRIPTYISRGVDPYTGSPFRVVGVGEINASFGPVLPSSVIPGLLPLNGSYYTEDTDRPTNQRARQVRPVRRQPHTFSHRCNESPHSRILTVPPHVP